MVEHKITKCSCESCKMKFKKPPHVAHHCIEAAQKDPLETQTWRRPLSRHWRKTFRVDVHVRCIDLPYPFQTCNLRTVAGLHPASLYRPATAVPRLPRSPYRSLHPSRTFVLCAKATSCWAPPYSCACALCSFGWFCTLNQGLLALHYSDYTTGKEPCLGY